MWANQQSITARNPLFSISRKVNVLSRKKNHNMKLLNGASDWKVSADLKTSQQFTVHIIQTEKRLDIVAWSDSKKSVLIELTVPREENREEAHERKKNRYETLRADCVEKGWICHVIPIEVGCRGFLGHSVILFLSKSLAAVWKLPQIVFRPRRNMHQVGFGRKPEVFSMKEIHAEPTFPCDYVRNGYCKRVITLTAESKRFFCVFGFFKSQTAH